MVRLAVIGVGRMGSTHTRNIFSGAVKGATLVALCDVLPEVQEKCNKKYPKVPFFSDYKKMLEECKIDGVVIATQHYFHVEIAKYCISKGVNVLVEKPLGVTTKEASELVELDRTTSGMSNAIMLNQRTNPLYRRAKKLVSSGVIGDIQRINYIITNWYRSQAYYDQGGWRASLSGEGGGTLINQCVHQLDLLQWICGMPKAVRCEMFTKNRDISTENDVTAVFDYENDVKCCFTASTHELRGTNRLEISGTKGRIVVDGLKMKVYTFYKSEIEVNATTKFGYGVVARKTKRYDHRLGFALGAIKGEQVNIVKNFANAIAGKEELISPICDGLNGVELINSMYMSAWTENKVDMPCDKNKYYNLLAEKVQIENNNKK